MTEYDRSHIWLQMNHFYTVVPLLVATPQQRPPSLMWPEVLGKQAGLITRIRGGILYTCIIPAICIQLSFKHPFTHAIPV